MPFTPREFKKEQIVTGLSVLNKMQKPTGSRTFCTEDQNKMRQALYAIYALLPANMNAPIVLRGSKGVGLVGLAAPRFSICLTAEQAAVLFPYLQGESKVENDVKFTPETCDRLASIFHQPNMRQHQGTGEWQTMQLVFNGGSAQQDAANAARALAAIFPEGTFRDLVFPDAFDSIHYGVKGSTLQAGDCFVRIYPTTWVKIAGDLCNASGAAAAPAPAAP